MKPSMGGVDAPPGLLDPELYAAQVFQGEGDDVSGPRKLRGDEAAGHDDVLAQQPAPVRREVVGYPCDGVEGMAHSLGAPALADGLAVDGGNAADSAEIHGFPGGHGWAQHRALAPAVVGDQLEGLAGELGVELETFQSNHEGALVDRVHERADGADGFVVNAGGYTHTSVALRDALTGVGLPFVEVHVSNIHAREPFRRESLLAPVAIGQVTGFGAEGYLLALRGLVRHLQHAKRG
mgnify:CR=1 FL=1